MAAVEEQVAEAAHRAGHVAQRNTRLNRPPRDYIRQKSHVLQLTWCSSAGSLARRCSTKTRNVRRLPISPTASTVSEQWVALLAGWR